MELPKKKIIHLLESREGIAVVAKRFVSNETKIRPIRDNKQKIRESASKLEPYDKFCKISRSCSDFKLTWTDVRP